MESKKLTPVVELIKNGFKIFFKGENFVHILKFVGIQILLFIAAFIPAGILIYLSAGSSFISAVLNKGSVPSGPLMFVIPIGLIFFVAVIVIGLWTGVAIVLAVNQTITGKLLEVKPTLSLAWEKVWRYFGVSLIGGLIIMLGFVLLVIPGIIFSVWFGFATLFVVLGNLGPMDALKKSKALVSGYFWPVIGRFVVFLLFGALVSIVLNLIPVLGPIARMLLVSPFFILLHILLFRDLQRVKA